MPTLMMSIIHLTGDASAAATDRSARRQTMPGDVDGGLSTPTRRRCARMALEALRAYRDRGGTLPPRTVAGDDPRDDELHGRRGGARTSTCRCCSRRWRSTAATRATSRGTACRPSGGRASTSSSSAPACRACWRRSARAGRHPVRRAREERRASAARGSRTAIPAAASTWRTTSTATRSSPTTTGRSSSRSAASCASTSSAAPTGTACAQRIRFGTEVLAARWDDAAARWELRVRGRDGARGDARRQRAHQRRRPAQPTDACPTFPDASRSPGRRSTPPSGSTSTTSTGKRVAVIGTGASAFQLVPEVAKVASRLVVFQRSPPWMVPNPRYHARVSEAKKWLLRARAVLRALVSLPAVLAGLGRPACRRSSSIPSGRIPSARSTPSTT